MSLGFVTQTMTAQSTVEAELLALIYGAQEAVYPSNRLLSQLPFKEQYSSIRAVWLRLKTPHIAQAQSTLLEELVKSTKFVYLGIK